MSARSRTDDVTKKKKTYNQVDVQLLLRIQLAWIPQTWREAHPGIDLYEPASLCSVAIERLTVDKLSRWPTL